MTWLAKDQILTLSPSLLAKTLPIRRLKNPRILKSQIKRDEHVCAHVLTLISIKQALARMILNRQEIDISIVTALLRNCLAQVFFKEYSFFPPK